MQNLKKNIIIFSLFWAAALILSCGGSKKKQGGIGSQLHPKIPADWDPTQDYPGNPYKISDL